MAMAAVPRPMAIPSQFNLPRTSNPDFRRRPSLGRSNTCKSFHGPRSRRSSSTAQGPSSDECRALYYRSVELFRPAMSPTTSPRPSTSYTRSMSKVFARHDSAVSYTDLALCTTARSGRASLAASPPMSPIWQSPALPQFDDDIKALDDSPVQVHVPPQTVIDWTSPETRKREHEEIDRSQKGLRRVFRKVIPKCLRHRMQQRRGFYGEKGWEEGDGDSVRRYRVGNTTW